MNLIFLKFFKKAMVLGDQAELILITSSPTTSYVVFSKFLDHSEPECMVVFVIQKERK